MLDSPPSVLLMRFLSDGHSLVGRWTLPSEKLYFDVHGVLFRGALQLGGEGSDARSTVAPVRDASNFMSFWLLACI